MVISGVHIDPVTGKPVRYRVENSWGEDAGSKGWFLMTDDWFSEYASLPVNSCLYSIIDVPFTRFVYQVVVPRALAPKELVKIYDADERVVLPAWDPMVRSFFFTLYGRLS